MTDSIYGILKYTSNGLNGGGKYGQQPKLTFSAAPFDAIALQGNRVQLVWNDPAGSDSQTFTAIRLIRNYDQYPEHAEDGQIILQTYGAKNPALDGNFRSYYNGTLLNGHIDTGLSGGRYAYYAIWVRMDSNFSDAPLEWFRVGTRHVLIPSAHDTKTRKYTVESKVVNGEIVDTKVPVQTLLTTNDKFVQALPEIFTRDKNFRGGEDSTLRNFLIPFSFTLDETLTYADLTIPDASGRRTAPSLLALQAYQFGLPADANGVTNAQKRLVRDALHIYSRKGTRAGLEEFVQDVTGYNPTITVSQNLLPSIQEASFYKGKGFWTESPSVPASGTAPIELTAIQSTVGVPQSNDTHDVIYDTSWVGKVEVATAGSKITLGTDKPMTRAIPVKANTRYYINFGAYATDTSKTGSMKFIWMNADGTVSPQNDYPAQSFSMTQNSWYRFWGGGSMSGTETKWLGIEITFDQTGTYYLDKVCVYEEGPHRDGTAMTTQFYVEPKMLDIFLEPSKMNYITNPSFETNTTGWVGSGVTLTKFDTTNGATPTPAVTHAGPSEVVGNRYILRGVSGGSGGTITPTPLVSTTIGDDFFTWSCYTELPDATTLSPTLALSAKVDVRWTSIVRTTNVLTIKFNSRHPFNIGDTIVLTSGTSTFNGITHTITANDLVGIDTIKFANTGTNTTGTADLSGYTEYVSTSRTSATTPALLGAGWHRLETSVYVPAQWESSRVTVAPTIIMEASKTLYFEAAQLERGQSATDYFDGYLTYQGCNWVGTANASYSAKYTNRRRRMVRLLNEVEDYLPINTVYQVRDYVSTQPAQLSV